MSNQQEVRAIIFLVLAAILWSLGGILIKWIEWNPVAIAGVRSGIAALLILTILRRPRLNWSVPQIGGAIAYAGTVILFVMANKLTTAANAILLQYTAPIYVALFGAWFLKERTNWMDWATIFCVLGGMVLFFLDDVSGGGLLGNILAVCSGLCFAALVLFMRKQKDESPLESVFWGNILTALIGLPFMFGSMPSTSSWVGLLFLGVFQLGFSYILYSIAIKQVRALEAILIPVIEPILNPIWVFLLMGETPGPWALVGGVIVIISVTSRCIISTFKNSATVELENSLVVSKSD